MVTPVVAFYLLYDWHKMMRSVDDAVPVISARRCGAWRANRRRDCRVRARANAVCLILGTFYAVGADDYGAQFRIADRADRRADHLHALCRLVDRPLLALGVAVAQFWPNWGSMVMVLGIFLVGQFAEGYILSPKLVGERVGLHPVWLMFALLAFGYLFGFVGLLVAVPLAATIGVLARFALERYLRKFDLYRRRPAGAMQPGRHRERPRRQSDASLRSRSIMPESFAREDFLAGPCNAAALALIERWPDWPTAVMALARPEGSGKSHLAAIWAARVGARTISRALARPRRSSGRARHRRAGAGGSRRRGASTSAALFHLLNLAREEAPIVLITARTAPAGLGSTSAILLRACARCRCVALEPPDDALLRARDRQACSPTGSSWSTRPGRLSGQPHRALVCCRARGGGAARRGGAAAAAAGDPGACRPSCSGRSLDGKP